MNTELIIKAVTNSEWDAVDFFVTDIDIKLLEKLDDKVHFLKEEFPNLAHVSLYESGTFFCADADGNTPLTDEDGEESYFSVKDFNEEPYNYPEQRIDAIQMKIFGDGSITFLGYGEYTSEEFWTEKINIESIKNALLKSKSE